MRPAVLAVCVITLSCLTAQALTQSKSKTPRGRIAGLITDEASHPIIEAILGIAETTAQGEINEMAPMTNEHGTFDWPDLPPGRYTLLINAPGFKAHKHIVEVKSGETTQTKIVMKK